MMQNRIEKERRFWNSFSSKYDRFISSTLGATYQRLYQMLKNDISGAGRILEVATGTGLLAFEISAFVREIVAIDIAPEMIQIARRKLIDKNIANIGFEVGDSCNLAFGENSFDVVIASNVLHLLFDPAKSLSEIRRVLKNEGVAILPTFCHGENIKSRIISGFMSLFGFKARNKWNISGFKMFVENNGFTISKSEVIQSKIPLLYCVARLKK